MIMTMILSSDFEFFVALGIWIFVQGNQVQSQE